MVASSHFTEADRKAISEAIAAAERATSGEIVPVVATRSGDYDRAEDLAGLGAAMVAVWGAATIPHGAPLPFVAPVAAFVGFWIGVFVARFCPPAIRFLASRRMQEEVSRAAAEAFESFHVRGTRARTGVVIFVSLYERGVCVLGDEAIGQKIQASDWDDIARLAVEGLRGGKPAEGLTRAIARAGELLARHFPVQPGDVNELTNELRLID